MLHGPTSYTRIELLSQNLDRFFLSENFHNCMSILSMLLRETVKDGMRNLKIKEKEKIHSVFMDYSLLNIDQNPSYSAVLENINLRNPFSADFQLTLKGKFSHFLCWPFKFPFRYGLPL
jgi:hypothetical protein